MCRGHNVQMSMRTRILLFLFIFAAMPLLMAVVINLPLVLERVDTFYRQAFLQNLRADFIDLDQHLANRNANVRLLARLPDPAMLTTEVEIQEDRLEQDRQRYTAWVNRILREERDITEIRFLDKAGEDLMWLLRDKDTAAWYTPKEDLPPVSAELRKAVEQGDLTKVTFSAVSIDEKEGALSLQMMAPVEVKSGGAVIITVDITSLAQRDVKTQWVMDTGEYVQLGDMQTHDSNAFSDYVGLKELFSNRRIVSWENNERRVIWVPMFYTESGAPLWVGREVSLQPLIDFQSEMVQRVLAIIAGLIVLLLFSTRLVARRVEKLSNELIGGIRQTLESRKAVKFDWNDTKELRELSSDLTKLSTMHAEQAEAQKAHTKELEASNKYKSEFLANVSHELRTPLNSILLLSKLLAAEEAQLKEKQKQQAGVIHKAANDLKNLIDNILDLSKIEARKFDVHCEQIDVRQLIDDLYEMLEPQYQAKQLSFKIDHQHGAPSMIRSDADKLRQILKNFLANALKFTDQGQVTLRIAPTEKPYSVIFSVIDSGIGIAPEKQKKIFDAFQQADGSTNRKYGGTGLGLTISRQLARLMQGDIRLASQVGEGATFSLLLPLSCDSREIIEPEVIHVDDAKEIEAIEESAQTDLSSRRLLVIESSIARQLRISKAINACQGKVLFIDDLEEAKDVIKEEGATDALLIDQETALENAVELIQSLREAQETPFRLMMIKSSSNPTVNDTLSKVNFDADVLLSDDMKAFTQQVREHLE